MTSRSCRMRQMNVKGGRYELGWPTLVFVLASTGGASGSRRAFLDPGWAPTLFTIAAAASHCHPFASEVI